MNYEQRVRNLEALGGRASVPTTIRAYHTIIAPDQGVVGAYVEGRHFDRAEGESVDEFHLRVMRAIGWDS